MISDSVPSVKRQEIRLASRDEKEHGPWRRRSYSETWLSRSVPGRNAQPQANPNAAQLDTRARCGAFSDLRVATSGNYVEVMDLTERRCLSFARAWKRTAWQPITCQGSLPIKMHIASDLAMLRGRRED